MKRALIMHGWESNSTEHWFLEEKALLEKMGYEVLVPDMPNTMLPKMEEWVSVVKDFVSDEESVLIGHSLGGPTILRYLERASKKVDKAFIVAGFASALDTSTWASQETTEYPQAFVKDSFNWEVIKKNVGKLFILNQKDDEWVPKEKGEEIAEKTGGKLILVDGTDHFDKMDLDLINKNL